MRGSPRLELGSRVRRALKTHGARPNGPGPGRVRGRRGRGIGRGLRHGLGLVAGGLPAQPGREPFEPVGVEIGQRQGLRPVIAQLDQVALDQLAVLGEPRAVAAERGERGQPGRDSSLEAAAQEPLLEGGERGGAPDEPHDRIGRRPLGLVERAEPGVPAAP